MSLIAVMVVALHRPSLSIWKPGPDALFFRNAGAVTKLIWRARKPRRGKPCPKKASTSAERTEQMPEGPGDSRASSMPWNAASHCCFPVVLAVVIVTLLSFRRLSLWRVAEDRGWFQTLSPTVADGNAVLEPQRVFLTNLVYRGCIASRHKTR